MILDSIAFIALCALCLLFIFVALSQRKARLILLEKYVASEIEKSIFSKRLADILSEIETKKVEESEGFIRFVSESRDWAFKYIEDVQEALKAFDNAAGPELEYLYDHSRVNSDISSKAAIDKVYKEYKKLKEMLPDDVVN